MANRETTKVASKELGEERAPDASSNDAAPKANGELNGARHLHESRVRADANAPAHSHRSLNFQEEDAAAAEQYRIVRTKICQHPLQPKTLLISSPMSGDGKTVTSINLAAALSLQDARVLLVDYDFRRSSATRMLAAKAAPGFLDVLRGDYSLEASVVRITPYPNLYLLPPGSSQTAELRLSTKSRSLLDALRSEFNFLVVDGPAVDSSAEYELLLEACDGVVLVARQDHTNRQLWRRAVESVPKQKQLGVVLNCVKPWRLWKTQG